jgi:hypothetical protein
VAMQQHRKTRLAQASRRVLGEPPILKTAAA